MMGPRQVEQGALFYSFSLEAHVPADHLLRSIDRFPALSGPTPRIKLSPSRANFRTCTAAQGTASSPCSRRSR